MQQADVRLIIEGAPLAPGILRVLTDSDESKLEEVHYRLTNLGDIIWMAIDSVSRPRTGADDDPKETLSALRHIGTAVSDIAAIASGMVRKEQAA